MNQNWTKPFYGVSHLGICSQRTNWATVDDYGSFAVLSKWFPGCAFSPEQQTFDNVALARLAAESWLQ